MKLNGFKELLLKKAEGNDNLSTLIRFINDDFLAEEIFESLEKMAAHKGDKANSAVTSFAGSATDTDANMLRDAIGHHLSQVSAINKARPPKTEPRKITTEYTTHSPAPDTKVTKEHETHDVKMDPVAQQHMERAMHLADLAATASKHSLGKINFEHVPTHAWEMNRTGSHKRVDKNGQNKYADDQQGLKRRLSSGDSKKFPNHGYLMLDPHQDYQNKGKLQGHTGSYPFEEMKINGKYVPIDPNVEAATEFKEHPFDKHPMMTQEGKRRTWEKDESDRSDQSRQSYADALAKWHESPEVDQYLAEHEAMEDKDPEAYKARGMSPSQPVVNGVEGTPIRGVKKEVAEKPVKEKKAAAPAEEVAPATTTEAPAEKKVVRREAKQPKVPMKEQQETMGQLMEVKRALKANPGDEKLQSEADRLSKLVLSYGDK